jgi:type IV secretion system protein VirD4
MRGAEDTVRSILISVNARLAFLENQQVLRMLSKDEMDLAELGCGVNGDEVTRTALFCVIPDNDKSYNFIVGMLYSQVVQELYDLADFHYGGRLPIHVTFLMDEFCNVALPEDFCSLLSTMRGREISAVVIIQNFAQLKALFKDTWETVPGNCDTFIYLGGNEQSTHKYVSELLGKATIHKKSSGETKGKQGSLSHNFDVVGRELYTPDEVRKLDNKKCFVFIRGFDPILDEKFNPFLHPVFDQTADGKGAAYVHPGSSRSAVAASGFSLLSEKSLNYFDRRKENGENVHIDDVNGRQFGRLGQMGLHRSFTEWEDTVNNRIAHDEYSEEQIAAVMDALDRDVDRKKILAAFYPDVPVEEMTALWRGETETKETYKKR